MAREGVRLEQVSAAADALVASGIKPTIRLVRERLGDTGSPNTIHKHLATWSDSRPAAAAAPAELPQALVMAIGAEIGRVAAQARSEVEERLVHVQAEATELARAGDMLEVERDSLADQLGALASERDQLSGRAQQQATDLIELGQRLEREQHAAEAARVEQARTQLKVEGQADVMASQIEEIRRLRDELGIETRARIAAEQQAAVLAAKLEASDGRAMAADERAIKSEAATRVLSDELSAAKIEVQVKQGAYDTAMARVEQYELRMQDAMRDAENVRNELQRARQESVDEKSNKNTKAAERK